MYEPKAKVIKSVHYVPKTGRQLVQRYSDLTSIDGRKTSSIYPQKVCRRAMPLSVLHHASHAVPLAFDPRTRTTTLW